MRVREVMSLKEGSSIGPTMTSSTGMKDGHSKQHLATALRRVLAKSGSVHILYGSIRRLTAAPGRRSSPGRFRHSPSHPKELRMVPLTALCSRCFLHNICHDPTNRALVDSAMVS